MLAGQIKTTFVNKCMVMCDVIGLYFGKQIL